jgi:ABC-type sugar transport system substrate-binding protein
MRRRRPRLLSLFIFVVAELSAACSKPYHETNERYVFVATNIKLPYWQKAQAGFLDAAKALGVKGELLVRRAMPRTRN